MNPARPIHPALRPGSNDLGARSSTLTNDAVRGGTADKGAPR